MSRIILASGSPRRREILTQAGIDFIVEAADIDESIAASEPATIVERLAYEKAHEVWCRHEDAVVIGADTIVTIDGEIFGKPHDTGDAKAMLYRLSGRTHQVMTGVALLFSEPGEDEQSGAAAGYDGDAHTALNEVVFHSVTDVTFYELSEHEIDEYVATGEPMDKAGAYGIQGRGALLVERIDGDYLNVVGLPVSALNRHLRHYGLV